MILLTVLCSFCISAPAAGKTLEEMLPAPACADGWTMEEKAVLYTKDTLFDRINGEAELYFPYGFEVLVSARYASVKNPDLAVEADVYKMGSPLDAFGIFANYRKADDIVVTVGAGGTVSSSQLLFHQDRYFVRLQASGTSNLGQDVLLACAKAVSKNLPDRTNLPPELEAFRIDGVARRSERYTAQSLLGYSFFRRGITADASLDGDQALIFMVIEDSRAAAAKAFDLYRSFLKESGGDIKVSESREIISLSAVDPLYKNVFAEQHGRFIIGAVRFKDSPAAQSLVERLRRRLGEGGDGPTP